MNRDLLRILCCPVHKCDLELSVRSEQQGEIVEGDLYCSQCDFHYPIEGGIPNLLPPHLQKESSE